MGGGREGGKKKEGGRSMHLRVKITFHLLKAKRKKTGFDVCLNDR